MGSGRQYKLLRELGSGTFGTVYEAEAQSAGGFRKRVALKVLHPSWEQNPDAARRFRDEARLLGQLQHRHVQVDELVRFSGRWALVMEYVPGCDCSTVIKACRKAREAFPVPAALEILAAVASALDAAYTAAPDGEPLQVVHRDIKPSNLRLTQHGDVKVLDFGIARAQFKGREAITQRIRYGSVRYMAPERRRSGPDGPPADVYGLGCVLYELLVGRPFGNAEMDPVEHAQRVNAASQTVSRRLQDDVGSRIRELLAKMLAFDPDARPSAAMVEARSRRLSRLATGLDLSTFARMFIPRVYQDVPDRTMPVERLVSTDDAALDIQAPAADAQSGATFAWTSRIAPTGLPMRLVLVAAAAAAIALFVGAMELTQDARPTVRVMLDDPTR